eukprot:scpid49998/ scgid13459/ Spondin-1; F-spondin; Vascular smooth muscle cell growth-promoting factor
MATVNRGLSLVLLQLFLLLKDSAASPRTLCTGVSQGCHANGVATYVVTFHGEWRRPLPHPANAMFSPLVGASHSACASFWRPGGLATRGVEQVAETGMTNQIHSEFVAYNNQVLDVVQAEPLFEISAGSVSTNITVDRYHPLVTLLSMVAPSPDWFVGIYDQTLCSAEDTWLPSLSINLPVWDAGTDNGLHFTAADEEPQSHDTIALLTPDSSRSSVVPDATGSAGRVARLELRLVDVDNYKPVLSTSCQTCGRSGAGNGIQLCQCDEACHTGGEATYFVRVSTHWTSPPPPPNGHFSPLTVVSHSACSVLWRNRHHATEGLQRVAETGNRSLFLQEARSFKGHIGDVLEGMSMPAEGLVTGVIRVDRLHPVVSLASMMAPSPDWFVGLDSIPMCSGNGFHEFLQYRLFPWDAGTDAGLTFTSPNNANNPHEPLVRIRSANEPTGSVFRNQEVVPVATVTFQRIALDASPVDSNPNRTLCPVCKDDEVCTPSYDVGFTNGMNNTLQQAMPVTENACATETSGGDFSRSELIAYCIICGLVGIALGTLFVALLSFFVSRKSRRAAISQSSTSSSQPLEGKNDYRSILF